MDKPARGSAFKQLLHTEWQHLTTFQRSNRRWPMPLAAALASGLPLLIGTALGHLEYGLVGSLGGLVFLYLPNTTMSHRMVVLMASGFAMSACYTLGMLSQLLPALTLPMLVFVAILVTMICRFYRLGPPGSLFFVMAAAIGTFTPVAPLEIPQRVGLMLMGSLLAALIAFVYSLHALRSREPDAATTPAASFDYVVFDSVVIGLFVALSLALAQLFAMPKPYWVPVSCLAVIQGTSLRAVWNRQLHRILGTGAGLLVAWALLSLPLDAWRISLIMMALAFVIEMLVVRHYAIAVTFITPLTLLLAEATTLGQGTPSGLIRARFFDTLLGCLIGLLGGICLHNPRFREVVGRPIRWLAPKRLHVD
ncbi:MAG: FUSC family protein [Steroidobacteraceae bacterium]